MNCLLFDHEVSPHGPFLSFAIWEVFGQPDFQKRFQTAFSEVENGGVIELPEGTYLLEVSLWLDGKENVTIRGKGMDGPS